MKEEQVKELIKEQEEGERKLAVLQAPQYFPNSKCSGNIHWSDGAYFEIDSEGKRIEYTGVELHQKGLFEKVYLHRAVFLTVEGARRYASMHSHHFPNGFNIRLVKPIGTLLSILSVKNTEELKQIEVPKLRREISREECQRNPIFLIRKYLDVNGVDWHETIAISLTREEGNQYIRDLPYTDIFCISAEGALEETIKNFFRKGKKIQDPKRKPTIEELLERGIIPTLKKGIKASRHQGIKEAKSKQECNILRLLETIVVEAVSDRDSTESLMVIGKKAAEIFPKLFKEAIQ